jgi:hypothetical protein
MGVRSEEEEDSGVQKLCSKILIMLSRSKVHVRWRREVTMRERLSLLAIRA